ncbi:hypothetical protein EDB81DRAFT_873840 [Dactylonectria macrodidyma]|uniref:Uncharacterized protein n=1 Tax=Dactylonectria macrodidyma TaxID=307937 RepID=A0A9P9D0M8_9HYPO|nr:hypothetical protein EDB81DRAFT_873840 [Dactylonectria macrodidyma]
MPLPRPLLDPRLLFDCAAKDRSWFGADYTPLNSTVGHLIGGIQTPGCICNVIGSPILDEYDIHTGSSVQNTKGTIIDKQGRTVAYFDPHGKFFQVRFSSPPVGPRVGPMPFDPSAMYWMNVRWADSEREKWEASRAGQDLQPAENVPPSSTPCHRLGRLTLWLKKHWGSEFRFLASDGLNINKEEDREEGRSILRAILADNRRLRRGQVYC